MDEDMDLFGAAEISAHILEKKPMESVFRDQKMLNQEYIPRKLIARDDQIMEVAALFRPILLKNEPHHAMIHGLPGCGKSVVIRYVIEKLNQDIIKYKLGKTVNLVSVQCNVPGISKVLQAILYQLDPAGKLPKQGLSIAAYTDLILKQMNKTGESLVLILEEFDKISSTDILYPLTRAYEQGTLDRGVYLSIVGISNDIHFYKTIDSRILSSMGAQMKVFPSYSAPELVQILEARHDAFRPGTLNDDVIPYCAAISGKEKGDAREAIMLLRGAGEVADKQRSAMVTVEHVKQARYLLEEAPDYKAVQALPPVHRQGLCAFLILKGEGMEEIWTRDLYQKYTEISLSIGSEPVTLKRFSETISEMHMFGIIKAEQQSRGRYGQSRKISLVPGIKSIRAALSRDSQFGLLLDLAPENKHSSPKSSDADLIKYSEQLF